LKPTNAFMTGKLKLKGDMGKAMALEKMMKKMPGRGFHTSAYRGGDVSKVFDDVKGVLDEGLVKKVNAVYAFKVEGSEGGTWFIDLKNGAGSVGSGEPTSGAADVTFTLKEADFISMFQGKLKPTNAFMTGKLKLAGDMGKAMALEKMMKKMNTRHFHSNAFQGVRDYSTPASPLAYENVPQVFERIEAICNEEIVKQVGSTFLFDIEGVGKYYLDFKNGAGKVVQAEPDTKPDVTIIMNEQIALKIFNRELKAAAAFMTGQIKARGDLAKAFALEKVLAAARDARLKEQGSQE